MKVLRPLKAIRAKCRECQGNRYGQIRHCETTDCPLWSYRLGHRPDRNDLASETHHG